MVLVVTHARGQICVLAALGILMMLITSACGDAITDNTYQGEVLFEISGTVYGRIPVDLEVNVVRTTVVWVDEDADAFQELELDELAKQGATPSGIFPASYQLQLFQPPPEAVLNELNNDPALAYALGILIIYNDADGDGRLDEEAGDTIFGGAQNQLLLYTASALTPAQFPTLNAPVEAGYTLVRPQGDATNCADKMARQTFNACIGEIIAGQDDDESDDMMMQTGGTMAPMGGMMPPPPGGMMMPRPGGMMPPPPSAVNRVQDFANLEVLEDNNDVDLVFDRALFSDDGLEKLVCELECPELQSLSSNTMTPP